ncbi:protein FAM174C [Rhineura floridana]|uniref:protein FAM174C n=1 Tax=Rhineura floridana TaxID=261503 RepID=UPI002AC88B90|nr:protein FAM174C [Rhineura floridana]
MATATRFALAATLLALAAASNKTSRAQNDSALLPGSENHPSREGAGPSTINPARTTTTTSGHSSSSGLLGIRMPAVHRALYVIAGVAGIGLLYYVGGRALRTRKPLRKKYGLLSSSEDHMEMASLESDEDTLFETRNLRR